MVVAEIHQIPARNSAYSTDALKAWWHHTVEVDGKEINRGVSTLSLVKKMFFLTGLLTGARAGSITALRWQDVDFDAKTMKFTTAKAGRVYGVPMSELLTRLLTAYKADPKLLPSVWVFPSSARDGEHIGEVNDAKHGVKGPHALRHSFRTTLAAIGAPPDSARLLMGHSAGDVSSNYITSSLLMESLRPLTNLISDRYVKTIPELAELLAKSQTTTN
jgi:integrase